MHRNRQTLMFFGRKGALIEMPVGASSDYYGKVQREFALLAGADKDAKEGFRDFAEMRSLYPDQVAEGVYYHEELAGSSGSSFQLFKLPNVTPEQLDKAKAKLCRERDVVRLHVVRIDEILPYAMPSHPMAKPGALNLPPVKPDEEAALLRQPLSCPAEPNAPDPLLLAMTDEQLQAQIGTLEEGQGACHEQMAEIDGEACAYGDSPPGSGQKRSNLSQAIAEMTREMHTLGDEWRRRHPVPPEPTPPPAGDDGPCPF